MALRSLFLFLLISCHIAVIAQKPKLPADVKENIEHRIKIGKNPSIVVGIIEGDKVAYYAFGKTKAGGVKVDEHSVYEIGSISKTFTAILLADQSLKGTLKLDDPVQRYLPSNVVMPMYEGANITLAHLSDHTSSLPRLPANMVPAEPLNPYADYTVENMYDFLSSHQLRRSVGSQYEYSNLAVGLLGHVLEMKTGISFEEMLRVIITNPLHMHATVIKPDANMKKHLAIGHANGMEVPNWDLPALAGAGGIRSSVYDMVLYLKANMKYDASSLSKAMQLTHQPRHDKAGGSSVGLGWHITPATHGDIIWHNGGTGGYRAFAGFDKQANKGVVVLTNSDQGADDIGFHLLDPLSPLEPINTPVVIPLGEYINSEGVDGLDKKFLSLKSTGEYHVDENDINALGYYYMGQRNLKAAKALFAINMREFPASFNVYDSYAESLMESGELDSAKHYYRKSIEINPGNTNGIDMLAKMGVPIESATVEITEALLDSYVGTYELAPGFNIVITRRGKQMFGQATGQDEFEMFPKSENEFYLKVTPASAMFSQDPQGAWSMTWMQNGQILPCKKIN